MTSRPVLSPFVYWGQTKDQITLNVALRDVEDSVIDLTDEHLSFKGNGEGLQGFKQYMFTLQFYHEIDDKKSKYKITAKNVEFQIVKKSREVWPRLTYGTEKPEWLKVNFDQFAFEDSSSSSSEDDQEQEAQLRREFAQREAAALEQREWSKMRQFYLVVFNLFMFFGYTYIFIGLLLKYYQLGKAFQLSAFEYFGAQMMMLQIMMILEVIHPVFGVVKAAPLPPLLQFLGRGFVLFVVIVPNPEVQAKAVVWWLFLSWSLAEVCRYPYYILGSYDREVGLVTYIRYTAWIVLYPAGIVSEGLIMLESLHFYDHSGFWSLVLPNKYNMSFSFPAFLRLYMLAFLPAGLLLINHMYTQRKKKISPNMWKREQLKKQRKLGAKGPAVFSQKVHKLQ